MEYDSNICGSTHVTIGGCMMRWDNLIVNSKPKTAPTMLSLEEKKLLAKKLESYVLEERYPTWHPINFMELEGEEKPSYPFLLIYRDIQTIHFQKQMNTPTPRSFLRQKKINLCIPVFFQSNEHFPLSEEQMSELEPLYHDIIIHDKLYNIVKKMDSIIDKFQS